MQLIAIARHGVEYVADCINIDPASNVWEVAKATLPPEFELIAVVEGARGNDALVLLNGALVNLREELPAQEPGKIATIPEPVFDKPKSKTKAKR